MRGEHTIIWGHNPQFLHAFIPTPDVYMILQMLYIFQGNYKLSLVGNHGFDNKIDDMKTPFLARGPDFKCNHKQEQMKSVDVYPLLCHLLNLQTCHNSRGSLQSTQGLLSSDYCIPDSSAAKVTTPVYASSTRVRVV